MAAQGLTAGVSGAAGHGGDRTGEMGPTHERFCLDIS